jgi:hypothetical protein
MNKAIWLVRAAGVLALSALLAACPGGGDGGGGGNNGGGNGGGNNGGSSAANAVGGVVSDIGNGATLSGATVKRVGGTETALTDARGQFLFTNLPAGTVNFSVSVDGYAPGYATAISSSSAQTVLIALKKEGQLQAYNATTTATLSQTTESGPYAVIFPPNSLDTTDTNLRVSVTPLDPTKEAAALPGNLVAGGALPTPLAAVTFAEFSILDSAGKRVNLKSSASAVVELPIPPSLRAQYPLGSTIHCYAYNPVTGKWEDFVEGTVVVSSVDGVTPVLRASVRHFSWYGGAPAVKDQRCTAVRIVSALTGQPLPGAVVTAQPGLSAVTNAAGDAFVTTGSGRVNFVASKTYTDTFVDAKGNLIPQKGSKVIEIGRVEGDDLAALSSAPCAASSSQPGAVRPQGLGDPGNPLKITTGLLPNGVFEANAIISGGIVSVGLQSGTPNADGDLTDPVPALNAKIALSDPSGNRTSLQDIGGGNYVAFNTPLQPGQRYTLLIDVDGNGTVDGTGFAYALGNVAWSVPQNGATYNAGGFTASWTDSASSVPGYAGFYIASVVGGTGGDSYLGTDRSFQPKNGDANLPAGTYTATLQAFGGAPSGLGSNASVSDNITGIGVQGNFISLAAAPTVTFTLR